MRLYARKKNWSIGMVNKLERFEMRATAEFLEAVDEWRRKQPDIPNRSEAIRRLVEKALAKTRK